MSGMSRHRSEYTLSVLQLETPFTGAGQIQSFMGISSQMEYIWLLALTAVGMPCKVQFVHGQLSSTHARSLSSLESHVVQVEAKAQAGIVMGHS
jgi:hypothetical protein